MKILLKRALSFAIALVMVLSMVPAVAFAAEAVSYTSYSWNGSKLVSSVNTVSSYTEVTSATKTMSDGWYVAKGNVTVNARVKVTGTVNLVLMDNCSLTTTGSLWLNKGNTLNVYAQSADPAVMGKLSCKGGYEHAGIGSNKFNDCGDLNVYGGIITATGGYDGAGIGSGSGSQNTRATNGGNVTVYSGVVTATGGSRSAGIGCGYTYITDYDNIPDFGGGTLTVYGGTVTATSGSSGTGIGGGYTGHGADVTVYGGTVTAVGKHTGIGGGRYGNGGNVTIYGGAVYATAGSASSSPGIGAGYKGEYGGSINIHGGTVVAQGSEDFSSGIGGGTTGFDCTITGGTVTAIGGMYAAGIGGCYASSATPGGDVVITGGNVMAIKGASAIDAIGAPYKGTNSGTLTDGNGNNVYLNTITLEDVEESTRIEAFNGIGSYSLKDVYTLDTNKLFLYLPEGVTPGITTMNGQLLCGKMENREGTFGTTCHAPSVNWTVTDSEHYRICANGCGTKLEQSTHGGSTATCLEPAYCASCGYKYAGINKDNHETDEFYYKYVDETTHTKHMACCDALVETLSHENVTDATCLGIAHCGICDTSYGQTDAGNHTGQLQWVSVDKKTHIQKWSCCGLTEGEATAHQLTYTADGLTISAVCDLCKAEGTVTMSMSGGTYNGYSYTAKAASTGIFEGWQPYEKPVFTYCCEDGCKKVGDHEVAMTLGDASVKAPFTVTQKELTVSYVQAYYKSYDGTSTLEALDLKLDGIVVYSEGRYAEEWDDVRDDVDVDLSALTVTVPDCVPGTYETAAVTGIKLVGADAENYTVVEAHDSVPLKDWIGYDGLTIDMTTVWIFPEDQYLEGDAQLDQTAYAVEGLDEQFAITGIALYDNGYGKINVDTSAIVITEDGADVTEYFYIDTYNANLVRVCQGHVTDADGFCSTGSCETYEEANLITETDEWGGEREVYQIWNAGQLYWFAEQVNKYGNGSINGKLMTNIVVNEDLTAENLREWTPIGRNYPAFTGSFDGQGYAVSGLYFSDPAADYVGLFGYTDYGYSISNVHLTNSYFEADSNVGGIFGYACSYISNCTVSDTVTVKGFSNVGGLVGTSSYGELSSSWSAATVIATDHEDMPAYYVGGLVGYNCLTVSNCYTTADKLVGVNRDSYGGSLTNCYYQAEAETDDGGKTTAQFASGEVAYLLQSGIKGAEIYDDDWNLIGYEEGTHVWGQKIGKDPYPVLGGMKVYLLDDGTYSNTMPGAAAQVGMTQYTTVQEAVDNASGGYVKLLADSAETVTASGDLYLDLNGYDLAGLTVIDGTLYGMDSTTDDYDCESGYGTIGSFTGTYENQHKTSITGAVRRYVGIMEEGKLSFHRIYAAVTHITLRPANAGVGYKAAFYGDQMIQKYLTSYGFNVWVTENNKLSKSATEFTAGASGNIKTLRIENILSGTAADAAAVQTLIYADAFATLTVNGQVIEIETGPVSGSLKALLEAVNANTAAYSEEQLTALKALVTTYAAALEEAGCTVDNLK